MHVPKVPPHEPLFATHVLFRQQPPPPHWLPGQQGWPPEPQNAQVPLRHAVPEAVHVCPLQQA
jgi:hypothetical protein